MKESRKEFIKKAHSAACYDWKQNIEKEFPKLFKKEEIYGWYKSKELKGWCVFLENGLSIYGIDSFGDWFEGHGYNYQLHKDDYKATDKEVEEALIKEAKKRGFKEGVTVDKVNLSDDYNPNNKLKENTINTNELLSHGYLWVSSILIYDNGEWATIIKETITKEQAEKELGKTILN
tara:strand:+ start:41 stop:571 length:531 start_codon:yes stop_codon:yes gene_type:complete